MKWGTKYDATYVNKLHSMVSRHLTLPHRFVCFTDNSAGFHPSIEAFPMPSPDLMNETARGSWNKVHTLRSDLGRLKGRTLFLDLDIVILQNIDCFFELPGEFCIIKEWSQSSHGLGNSSVYRFEAGAHANVYENLIANRSAVYKQYRHEQAYVTGTISQTTPLTYWPEEWCRSFKRHCLPSWPLNWVRSPSIPDDVKILIFHGDPKPEDAIIGSRYKLHRIRATPSLADHWR